MIRGTAVLELQRNAEWIKVALPETAGEQGWVHSSLLSTEPPD
jgi:SH3-like domain-containing protein